MNTSGTSRNTTMTCVTEEKKPHSQKPRTTCVGEDSNNQLVVKNTTCRSVEVQTEQGSQRKNRTRLRRRSWNQKATQPATPRATAILPKQDLETRVERSNEGLADDRTTTQLHQPEERPDNPPLERDG